MTSKLFCRRTLSCRLRVHSSPGCQAAKLPLQGGGWSAPPHHDWQHLLPGGCPKWPPCPVSFPSWPCPAGLPEAWKPSESSRRGEARQGEAWSRGGRGGPARELPLLGGGCSPPPLARLLPLGLRSWFRRLLWIAVTGVKFHQRPAPQLSLCSAVIRLKAMYTLNSSLSPPLKSHFSPHPPVCSFETESVGNYT